MTPLREKENMRTWYGRKGEWKTKSCKIVDFFSSMFKFLCWKASSSSLNQQRWANLGYVQTWPIWNDYDDGKAMTVFERATGISIYPAYIFFHHIFTHAHMPFSFFFFFFSWLAFYFSFYCAESWALECRFIAIRSAAIFVIFITATVDNAFLWSNFFQSPFCSAEIRTKKNKKSNLKVSKNKRKSTWLIQISGAFWWQAF